MDEAYKLTYMDREYLNFFDFNSGREAVPLHIQRIPDANFLCDGTLEGTTGPLVEGGKYILQ